MLTLAVEFMAQPTSNYQVYGNKRETNCTEGLSMMHIYLFEALPATRTNTQRRMGIVPRNPTKGDRTLLNLKGQHNNIMNGSKWHLSRLTHSLKTT